MGGEPPIDPKSLQDTYQSAHTKRYSADEKAMNKLKSTKRVIDVDESDYAALFFPGGHVRLCNQEIF